MDRETGGTDMCSTTIERPVHEAGVHDSARARVDMNKEGRTL
jgi:hypothetical protein